MQNNNINNEELLNGILSGPAMNPEQRKEMARLRLKELVIFAKENSPFYRELYWEIDPNNFVLTDLPVIDKKTLLNHFDEILTDPALIPSDIYEFIKDDANIGKNFHDHYSVVTTSGTNGNPLTVVRDSIHNKVHGLMVQSRLCQGFDPAVFTPVKSRIAVVIASKSNCSSYSSYTRMKKAFPDYDHNTRAFSITAPVREIVSGLNEFRPDVLTGYPSIMLILAHQQIIGRLKIDPAVIACSAETLTDSVFAKLKTAFPHAAVLNNYCTTEVGEVAMSCRCGRLHLNDDWIMLEAVDEQLEPVEDGTVSSAVIATDLSNHIMPIIRYRLDDRVQIHNEPCPCGSTLPVITVWSRSADTLEFHGVELHSTLFLVTMYEQCDILSWQFAQTSENTLEFRAVYSADSGDRMRDWVKKRFTQFLADHNCADVHFILSDSAPINSARGGKLKLVVKEC
ncbi:MAG: hypothetical protein Q4G69_10240 [Planctomycetia bacterium]|nr:hypothetical protein [Planctomycetia bacterium]